MATVENQSVDTGNTVLLMVNSKDVIGRAQSFSSRVDYGTTNIYEIGTIMPTESAFLKYTGTIDMERLRLKKHSLAHAGLVGLGEDILGVPAFKVTSIDRYTGEIGIVYQGCSATNFNTSMRANEVIQETASFYFLNSTGNGSYSPSFKAPTRRAYNEI